MCIRSPLSVPHSAVIPAKAGIHRATRELHNGSPPSRARQHGVTAAVIAAITTILALPAPALADKSQPLDQRKSAYAPWSPEQMAQRRKDYGLVGPGTNAPVPAPSF